MLQQQTFVRAVVVAALVGVGWLFSRPRPAIRSSRSPPAFVVIRSLLAAENSRPPADPDWKPRPRAADLVEFQPMRPETTAILRDAFVAATIRDQALQQANLEVLARLTKIRWPRIADLKRIDIEETQTGWIDATRGWLLAQDDKTVHWLADSFRVESADESDYDDLAYGFKAIQFTKLEDDLHALLADLADRDLTERDWDWEKRHGIPPFEGGVPLHLIRLAYAAAERGLRDETRAIVLAFFRLAPRGLPEVGDEFVWAHLERAAVALSSAVHPGRVIDNVEDWRQFVRTCRELQTVYPNSKHRSRLDSFVRSIEADLAKPVPTFVTRRRADLSEEETIRLLIHQFRDFTGQRFSGFGPNLFADESPAQRLVLIGTPALPYLVEAINDETPCRINDYNRHVIDNSKLLRRQDFVFECLERITGCTFFAGGTLGDEPKQRRASCVAHVRRWWALCRGAGQANMLRAYLRTLPNNAALNDPNLASTYGECRRKALTLVAHLDGPENVLEELRALPQAWFRRDKPTAVEEFYPAESAQRAFARLEANGLKAADLDDLLKYGDRETYLRLGELAAVDQLIPADLPMDECCADAESSKWCTAVWFYADHVKLAARHGRNWAIPFLFATLRTTTESDERDDDQIWIAEVAMQESIRLTGRDFGYDPTAPRNARDRAMAQARDWWQNGGQQELHELIHRDRPIPLEEGDQRLTERQIKQVAETIVTSAPDRHRETVARLGPIHSYQIQRALLDSLRREPLASERVRILQVLKTGPVAWQLPQLTQLFARDPSVACRVAAGRNLVRLLHDKSNDYAWVRLETRDAALNAARESLLGDGDPVEVRQTAYDMLLAWGSILDQPLMKKLEDQAPFHHRDLIVHYADVLGDDYTGKDFVTDLSNAVRTSEGKKREHAAAALAQLGNEAAAALPVLLEAVDDPDQSTRYAVSEALVAIAAQGTTEQLLQLFRDGQSPQCALDAAASALAELDMRVSAAVVVPHLAAAIREGDDKRREWAARHLSTYAAYAAQALPDLRSRPKSGYQPLQSAIELAIREIESAQRRKSKD